MRFSYVLKIAGAACLFAVTAVSGVLGATSAGDTVIAHNVPAFTKTAVRGKPTEPTKTIDVLIWLKVRNQASLDRLASELYDKESSIYHHWIKPADFETQFAPSSEDAATVKNFLTVNGLAVSEVGPKNMYVRARGTVAKVSKAFRTRLYDFTVKGQTIYANVSEPTVAGAAGPLIGAVYGLHNSQYTHPNATKIGAKTEIGPGTEGAARVSSATAAPISADCFSGKETESLTNSGTYPFVTLTGGGYATKSGALGGCGYTPAEIQTAYDLTGLYKEGFDGTGQTIVIIDWCGSPTIRSDANAFSAAFGLPLLTQAKFKIINSSTPATCGGPDIEINIDVEWAHAIAPGANIDLVVPPSPSSADVDSAEFFAVINNLGNVISGSYAAPEYTLSDTEVLTENLINEIAAVQGISANFSSGDYGDGSCDDPECPPPNVNAPADSPYATAIGGISLSLNSNKSIAWQSGWGTNTTPIISGGVIYDPPSEYAGFIFGSAGGRSAIFAKPLFQDKLKGTARLLPDISWLADPFTGGFIVISEPFQFPAQVYEIYGGTSLACPMFSALWAIANQEAGIALGQAAQYIYTMPSTTILDIKPVTSATNVTALYKESASVTDIYNAAALAQPLENTKEFVSAIWNIPLSEDTTSIVIFGTDTSLTTTEGWDNVTGLGVPNGKAFADYFQP